MTLRVASAMWCDIYVHPWLVAAVYLLIRLVSEFVALLHRPQSLLVLQLTSGLVCG